MGKTLEYMGSAKGPFVFNFQFCFRCCRGEDLMLFLSLIFNIFLLISMAVGVLVAVEAFLWLWRAGLLPVVERGLPIAVASLMAHGL